MSFAETSTGSSCVRELFFGDAQPNAERFVLYPSTNASFSPGTRATFRADASKRPDCNWKRCALLDAKPISPERCDRHEQITALDERAGISPARFAGLTAPAPANARWKKLLSEAYPASSLELQPVHVQRAVLDGRSWTFVWRDSDERSDVGIGEAVVVLPAGRVIALDGFLSLVSLSDVDHDGVVELMMSVASGRYGGAVGLALLGDDGFLPGFLGLASYGC